MDNPQDALVIEGYCFCDAVLKGRAVMTQSVVSKLGQQEHKNLASTNRLTT